MHSLQTLPNDIYKDDQRNARFKHHFLNIVTEEPNKNKWRLILRFVYISLTTILNISLDICPYL